MNSSRRPRAVTAMAISFGILTGLLLPGSTSAATTRGCDTGGSHIFSGNAHTVPSGKKLTDVRAFLDNQTVPLCVNGTPLAPSASLWWVMIAQPASNNDYIQYGFWNCKTACGFLAGTNNETHEFWERNNGNFNGNVRVDLGKPAIGSYLMEIYTAADGSHKMYRNGVVRATVAHDGWQDWSQVNAQFQLYSETWNRGDQNGGSDLNRVRMRNSDSALNGVMPPVSQTFPGGCVAGSGAGAFAGEYRCSNITTEVNRDGVDTWTINR